MNKLSASRVVRYLRPPSLTALSKDERVMAGARTLVAYYYAFMPFLALFFTSSPLRLKQNFEPLWPLSWAEAFGLPYLTVVDFVSILFIASAVLGALLHRHRFFRVLVFLGLWQAHALESSFGSPNHQWYLLLYTSLILIFLPDGKKREAPDADRRYLLYVWGAQAMAALTYTMAGAYKILDGFHQGAKGLVNTFSTDAFAYQIAYFVPRLQEPAPLADFIVTHSALAWPFYVAFVIVQASSLWVMVRPSLQKYWGAVIVTFHILTYFTMGIFFYPQLILVTLLFLNSPFAKPYGSVMAFVRDLPVVGQALDLGARYLRKRA